MLAKRMLITREGATYGGYSAGDHAHLKSNGKPCISCPICDPTCVDGYRAGGASDEGVRCTLPARVFTIRVSYRGTSPRGKVFDRFEDFEVRANELDEAIRRACYLWKQSGRHGKHEITARTMVAVTPACETCWSEEA